MPAKISTKNLPQEGMIRRIGEAKDPKKSGFATSTGNNKGRKTLFVKKSETNPPKFQQKKKMPFFIKQKNIIKARL